MQKYLNVFIYACEHAHIRTYKNMNAYIVRMCMYMYMYVYTRVSSYMRI
jgi:hypothetical protein